MVIELHVFTVDVSMLAECIALPDHVLCGVCALVAKGAEFGVSLREQVTALLVEFPQGQDSHQWSPFVFLEIVNCTGKYVVINWFVVVEFFALGGGVLITGAFNTTGDGRPEVLPRDVHDGYGIVDTTSNDKVIVESQVPLIEFKQEESDRAVRYAALVLFVVELDTRAVEVGAKCFSFSLDFNDPSNVFLQAWVLSTYAPQ